MPKTDKWKEPLEWQNLAKEFAAMEERQRLWKERLEWEKLGKEFAAMEERQRLLEKVLSPQQAREDRDYPRYKPPVCAWHRPPIGEPFRDALDGLIRRVEMRARNMIEFY